MTKTKSLAEQLWEKRYGKKRIVKDFHGNYMVLDGYGKKEYYQTINGKKVNCGWNLHHILPRSKGGELREGNIECTNFETNNKAGNKTTYWIDGVKYQVNKTSKGYIILKK